MSFEDLPQELVQFVALHIESVEQILILQILLHNPEKTWSTSDLTREMRSADTSIQRRLQSLYDKGLLSRKSGISEDQHIYAPASDAMDMKIRSLVKIFKERPSRMVELIYTKPHVAIQAFADSFKFRKDDE